ncbi:MAG: DUF2182 domain-containing protein [Gammaproteobacteria bacterium]|nr:DUF2182 domain-containing protein [Gammaproteobacteria bacterium]
MATALEAALRRDRRFVLAGLAAAVLLSWSWLVPAARDMYGAMDGPAAWMMAAAWDARYALLIFLMWAAMMVGMMLPSAAPAVLLFGQVVRSRVPPQAPVLRTYLFALGYLLAWTAFSAAATLLQWALAQAGLLSPMMQARGPLLGGALLLAAGAYQLSPLKHACLRQCRGPLDFLSRHWRPGLSGALRLGLAHGAWCVGCCWALMLLLFFGGVMHLGWIAAIGIFVLAEKLAPGGVQGGRLSGVLLIAAGIAFAALA